MDYHYSSPPAGRSTQRALIVLDLVLRMYLVADIVPTAHQNALVCFRFHLVWGVCS